MHMSAQENKALACRLFEEAFTQGNVEVVDEVLDPDFVCYPPSSETGEVREAQTIKGEIEYFRNALPDLAYTVEDQIAEGNKVATCYTVSGTHQGGVIRGWPLWRADHDDGDEHRPLKVERWWRSGPNTTC
jgi:ketosteroid isomerase-like protein